MCVLLCILFLIVGFACGSFDCFEVSIVKCRGLGFISVCWLADPVGFCLGCDLLGCVLILIWS